MDHATSDLEYWMPQRETCRDGRWYNERGMQICGHPTVNGVCRNPVQCRFHSQRPEHIKEHFKRHAQKRQGIWSVEEHMEFIKAIKLCGIGRWSDIAKVLGSRTPGQCQVHYFKMKQKLGISDDEFWDRIDMFIE